MVDKKKMGNLLIGMRLALGQPLTSALPTASGTMLPGGLLSKLQRQAGLLLASIRTALLLSLTATHSRQFLFPLPRPTPPVLLPG